MTIKTAAIFLGTIVTLAFLLASSGDAPLAQAPLPQARASQGRAPQAFRRQGFGGFGGGQEQQLVARYDKDKNGRLNREERNAARPAVGGGGGGFGRFRFAGGGGEPGRRLTP